MAILVLAKARIAKASGAFPPLGGLTAPLESPSCFATRITSAPLFQNPVSSSDSSYIILSYKYLVTCIEEEVPHCKLTAGINIKLPGTSQRINHISVHRKTNVKVT